MPGATGSSHGCQSVTGRRLWGTISSTGLFSGNCHAYCLTNTDYSPEYYGWKRIQDLANLAEQHSIDKDQFASFLRNMDEGAACGEYFYSINLYAFIGRKRNPQFLYN